MSVESYPLLRWKINVDRYALSWAVIDSLNNVQASISTNIFAFNFAKKTLLRRDKVLHIDFF